jgi:hypothetical protein
MDTQLSNNWLDFAASHGATKWIQKFIRMYLPQLEDQTISVDVFAQMLEEEFQARQLTTPAQQKNYRSNVVQALKSVVPDHRAISLVSPTTEQYRKLNEEQRERLADRETKYFTRSIAEALVERATNLLNSAEWSEVAAGLAVLVGRRISEILLSDFSPKTAWSLNFSEMSKKGAVDGLMIEIPTLAPAEIVLVAIGRLQRSLRIEDLKLGNLSPKMAKQTVNSHYSGFVATKCHEHFSDLVPARADGKNLYTHIFRACYATIAAHWFCPTNIPEHNFKAEIQGHFTLTKDGKKLPNYSARANYDDYAIGTENGNRDGRLGTKLGLLPQLQVVEAFRKETRKMNPIIIDKDKDKDGRVRYRVSDAPQKVMEDSSAEVKPSQTKFITPPLEEKTLMNRPTEKAKTKRPELHADDLLKMTKVMAKRGVVGSATELFHALIEAFELEQTEKQQQHTQTIGEVANTLNWFTGEIQSLRMKIADLEQERDRLRTAQSTTEELSHLRSENAQLRGELQDTQSRLEGIQKFLGGASQLSSAGTAAPIAAIAHNTVASVQAISQSGESKSASPEGRRNRGETTEKLNQIIDALISWNTSQEDTDTQMRISIPTIKGLASAMGANYQPAIQEVLKERSEELKEHHSRLLIGIRHNATVKRKDEVMRAIARAYLGLDNWTEVKY